MTVAVHQPSYTAPEHALTEDHVREALDFLVAIEPDPPSDTREQYLAAVAPPLQESAAALATLRRFAKQAWPMTLEQMQALYYRFTRDTRYMRSAVACSVVTTVLNQAWNGVGPWQR